VLVIDDFGRQHCSPRDLLNRWIVPLESRVDFLTLQTGQKFEMPFMVLVVFATNIKPAELVDEAFLRRIQYKVFAESPTRATSSSRSSRTTASTGRGLAYDRALVEDLLETTTAARHPASRLPAARPHRAGAGARRVPRASRRADAGAARGRLRQLLRGRRKRAPYAQTCMSLAARLLGGARSPLALVAGADVVRQPPPPPGRRPALRSHHLAARPHRPSRRPSASSPRCGRTRPACAPGQVRFFVDRELLGEVSRSAVGRRVGDDNPFERVRSP
jgi:hypothetical protein